MSTAVVEVEHRSNALAELPVQPVSTEAIRLQIAAIQEMLTHVLVDGVDYGVIPGTQKPTLYKPGAEKLMTMFKVRPERHETREDLPGGHREYKVRTRLIHIPSGDVVGEGGGICSTMESRYRYRWSERSCPRCSKATIKRSKDSGWYCWSKLGGCGATFKDGDAAIEGQHSGKVENPDLADVFNTVLKMAHKRADVAAIRTLTGVASVFMDDEPAEEPAKPRGGRKPQTGKMKTSAPAKPSGGQDTRNQSNVYSQVHSAIQAAEIPAQLHELTGTLADRDLSPGQREHLGKLIARRIDELQRDEAQEHPEDGGQLFDGDDGPNAYSQG